MFSKVIFKNKQQEVNIDEQNKISHCQFYLWKSYYGKDEIDIEYFTVTPLPNKLKNPINLLRIWQVQGLVNMARISPKNHLQLQKKRKL